MSDIARRTPVFVACTVLCALGSAKVWADATGQLAPTSVTNGACCGAAWTSPSSSVGSDDLRASSTTVSAAGFTDALIFTFSPGVPAGATIDGIEVFTEGQSGGTAATPVVGAAISLDGGSSFLNFSSSNFQAVPPGPADFIGTFGSPSDDWGGVTVANVNSAAFRLSLQGFDNSSAATDTYSIDDVTMTVYFTPAGAGLPLATPLTLTLSALALTLLGMFAVRRLRRQRGQLAHSH